MKITNVRGYPIIQEVVAILSLLAILLTAYDSWQLLPDPMAGKIGFNGARSAWLPPAAQLAILLAIFLALWATDIFLRYCWVLQENGTRRFNWLQMCSTPALTVVAWGWYVLVVNNTRHQNHPEFYLSELAALIAAVVVFLTVTELLRRPGERAQPRSVQSAAPDSAALNRIERLPARFAVVQCDRPVWLLFATVASIVIMSAGAIGMLWGAAVSPDAGLSLVLRGSAILVIAGCLVLVVFSGGFRFVVHSDGVDVRLGFGGIRLKYIAAREITSAAVREYSPLADFGGWGIRFGKDNTTAYILSGERGLELRTSTRNYLLSVKDPELLAQLITERHIRAHRTEVR